MRQNIFCLTSFIEGKLVRGVWRWRISAVVVVAVLTIRVEEQMTTDSIRDRIICSSYDN